nr:MAG TPA: hypothetical protein [Caudoviricetes sp.]
MRFGAPLVKQWAMGAWGNCRNTQVGESPLVQGCSYLYDGK